MPSEAAFAAWYESSPANFTFAVKVSRFITHIKRLKNTEEAVEKFISRAKILEEKLGPLLYQLPPNMRRNDETLESFLVTLPRGLKHVVEFRHQSWLEEKVLEILHKYNVGFCIFDMPSASCPLVATADFAYVRFHGSTGLYSSCYSDEELADWAGRLADLAANLKAVYIYFNNDAEAFAVRNAKTLRGYLETQEGMTNPCGEV
ncbi:unnamed protein product [marine sediment metagenome]|uniref:DUF72 domain-containing protein n=1 Tax=marine sediment metagenome TaxID=412755 RepID=X1S3L7_9ZZZZ